jgi:hypothetical protein
MDLLRGRRRVATSVHHSPSRGDRTLKLGSGTTSGYGRRRGESGEAGRSHQRPGEVERLEWNLCAARLHRHREFRVPERWIRILRRGRLDGLGQHGVPELPHGDCRQPRLDGLGQHDASERGLRSGSRSSGGLSGQRQQRVHRRYRLRPRRCDRHESLQRTTTCPQQPRHPRTLHRTPLRHWTGGAGNEKAASSLKRVGPEVVQALRERAAREIKTISSSHYTREGSLPESLQLDTIALYGHQSTG